MGERGLERGVRALVIGLMTVGSIVGTAPAAYAHGGHGAAPAALFEPAGPYVVSLWIEEFADQTITGSVLITGEGSATQPEIWLQTSQGRATIGGLADQHDGTWTAQFDSRVGDRFVIGWAAATGPGQRVFALQEIPAPWWFRSILWVVTPPGLWFGYWLLGRRRRAFAPLPTAA